MNRAEERIWAAEEPIWNVWKTRLPINGPSMPAYIKSALGIGMLLAEGIGDTLRVSLTTADKTDEVVAGFEILKALGL